MICFKCGKTIPETLVCPECGSNILQEQIRDIDDYCKSEIKKIIEQRQRIADET